MSEERLMKTPEEVKQKARELLQMPKEEVLTKYMFQEQEIERLHSIIKEAREYITYWHYRNDFRTNSFTTGVKEELLKILDKEQI